MTTPTLTPESARELVRKWRERAEEERTMWQDGGFPGIAIQVHEAHLKDARDLEALLDYGEEAIR